MQQNKVHTSLIISTYNWSQALNLCLLSVKGQKVLPDEVIVADDGSTVETKLLVEKFQYDFPVPLVHVWQPDEGFQLSRIRNKAIAAASHEYIIQVDGDLILHPMFVADHIAFSKKNSFVGGSRVMLGKQYSEQLTKEGKIGVYLLNKEVSNKLNGLRVKVLTAYLSEKYKVNDAFYLRGCNMAFWRDDLVKVNGYNEEFTGWGLEDNEIAVRLLNSGVQKRTLKFGGIVYHVYHPENKKTSVTQNRELLKEIMDSKKVVSPKGIKEHQ